jgi:hypothetical protein
MLRLSCFSLIAYLLLSGAALAQDKGKKTADTFAIQVSYDKFEDVTWVSTAPQRLIKDDLYRDLDSLACLVYYSYHGQVSSGPPTGVYLLFNSISREGQYLYDHQVYLIADGERLALGRARRDSRVGRGYILEMIGLTIDLPTLSKIANAQLLEIKVGRSLASLDHAGLAIFREMVERAAPVAAAKP